VGEDEAEEEGAKRRNVIPITDLLRCRVGSTYVVTAPERDTAQQHR